MDFQPFKPFQAFVNAASFSPTSPQKPRPRSARAGGSAPRVRLDRFFLPLPTPTPPSTRLAKEQAEPGELTAIDAAWATETIKEPDEPEVPEPLESPESPGPPEPPVLPELPGPPESPESPELVRQQSHRSASRSARRKPWQEEPPAHGLSPKAKWRRAVDAIHARNQSLVKHRSQVTRQVQKRVLAFDKRVAVLASGGSKVAAKEASLDEGENGGGLPLRLDAAITEEQEEKEELESMPFKVLEWSSQRGNFPAFNLLGHSSCWQSEIGMTRDQHLTLELDDIPAPVIALQMEFVTKEVTPKRCKMMFSVHSAMGPWQTAWTFLVPENIAEKGISFFNKSKEEVREGAESAPWWRLVVADNYGSQACIAIAAPLKLWVASRGDHTRLKYMRRNKITFLEDSFFAQKHMMNNMSADERTDRRLATTYKLDMEFIKKAHDQFNEIDRTSSGRWTKKDWQSWMLEFIPPKERPKVTPERMNFYWARVDKDANHCVDFEEFLIFVHVLNEMAQRYGKSTAEFLFPGIIKGAEGTEFKPESLVKLPSMDSMELQLKMSRRKQEEEFRDTLAQLSPRRNVTAVSRDHVVRGRVTTTISDLSDAVEAITAQHQ
ncbi:unnamed protein product [Effrenium voratum]|uniref:EF-hand domain-containing protein n=1 Tax=Effrenium voratum TaxID=2562239 RepID=A0AA36N8U6_9DINO|nr:unnamed protein product [Effrenium voratum]